VPRNLRPDFRAPEWMPRTPPIRPDATPGQRWRFRRNLVMYAAHRAGFSQRMLADVFDLPRSHVHEILGHMDAIAHRETALGDLDPGNHRA
jgi:hypothetical protein